MAESPKVASTREEKLKAREELRKKQAEKFARRAADAAQRSASNSEKSDKLSLKTTSTTNDLLKQIIQQLKENGGGGAGGMPPPKSPPIKLTKAEKLGNFATERAEAFAGSADNTYQKWATHAAIKGIRGIGRAITKKGKSGEETPSGDAPTGGDGDSKSAGRSSGGSFGEMSNSLASIDSGIKQLVKSVGRIEKGVTKKSLSAIENEREASDLIEGSAEKTTKKDSEGGNVLGSVISGLAELTGEITKTIAIFRALAALKTMGGMGGGGCCSGGYGGDGGGDVPDKRKPKPKKGPRGATKNPPKKLGGKSGAKFLKGASILTAGALAYDAYDEYQETGDVSNKTIGEGVGTMGGMWAGAATGAAIGALGGPIGVAAGGLIGGAIGAWGGGELGGKAGEHFDKPKTTAAAVAPPKAAITPAPKAAPPKAAPSKGSKTNHGAKAAGKGGLVPVLGATKVSSARPSEDTTDHGGSKESSSFFGEMQNKANGGSSGGSGGNIVSTASGGGGAFSGVYASGSNEGGGEGGQVLRAEGMLREIQYKDGSVESRRNGTRSWRNNNPGNLRPGKISKRNRQIGVDKDNFAIFGSMADGQAAQNDLLKNVYGNYSLRDMIYKYAPPSENNTAAYLKALVSATGASESTKLNDLSGGQFQSLIAAIHKHEGFKEGKVTRTGGASPAVAGGSGGSGGSATASASPSAGGSPSASPSAGSPPPLLAAPSKAPSSAPSSGAAKMSANTTAMAVATSSSPAKGGNSATPSAGGGSSGSGAKPPAATPPGPTRNDSPLKALQIAEMSSRLL